MRILARLGRAHRRQPVFQVAALVALFVYGAVTIDGFSQEQSIRSMLVLAALLGLAAAGQTFVLLLGGLDLSVPGLIVLGATVISELCGGRGWSFLPAFLVVLVLTGTVGAAVGWMSYRFQVTPIIMTLAVSSLALGGVQVWINGHLTGSAPAFLSKMTAADGTTFGVHISPVVVVWLGFAVLVAIVLYRTPIGRRLYAAGENPRAADLALVNTQRIWTGVFCVSAMLSGIVGVLLAGFAGADSTLGDPYLFQGLTVVIIGGTAFRGLRGDYTHTVIGAMILVVVTTIMLANGYDYADQQIFFGILILLVVAGYGRERKLRDRI